MGTKAIIARYAPDPIDGFVKWSGTAVLTDGSPDVVIPSLYRLRNVKVNDLGRSKFRGPRDMMHFLIEDHPGGWHSFQDIDRTQEPREIIDGNDREGWLEYLGDLRAPRKLRQPLYFNPWQSVNWTNTSAFYGNWAYVIVEDLDIVTIMAKYENDYGDYPNPRWAAVGSYPLHHTTNLRYPHVPKYEVWAQRAKDAHYLHPEDTRYNLEE